MQAGDETEIRRSTHTLCALCECADRNTRCFASLDVVLANLSEVLTESARNQPQVRVAVPWCCGSLVMHSKRTTPEGRPRLLLEYDYSRVRCRPTIVFDAEEGMAMGVPA